MAFLAEHRIPSAHPVADNHGQYLRELNGGKPAALVKRLNGASVDIPNRMQCAEIGKQMVRMHNASKEFNLHRKMVRGPKWWKATADNVMPCLAEEEASLLINELEYQFSHLYQDLPVGVIHADLFLDNALFVGDELTGIIDFYYACNNFFVYDLTVTINDWCTTGDNVRDLQNARVLLNAYQQERKVTAAGFDAWPTMPRAAALRFRLSRLQDKYFPRGGEITHIKDPDEFKLILQDRVENSDQMSKMWDHP
ncbi:MAG: homoserine kinase [Gammaproteobacteria bacterium]|nr:homoserine kinase [Gammaproteobacteria bacterium]